MTNNVSSEKMIGNTVISSQSNVTIIDTDQQRMVCTACGLLSEPQEGDYCKYAYHQTKFGKRIRTLILNDQSEFDELDAGTYKVVQQNDSDLLTVKEGEHSWSCICTKCMIADEERSFDSPWNQKELSTDISREMMKFIISDGVYGLSPEDALRMERRLEKFQVQNPEMKFGEKLVKYKLENGREVSLLPVVDQKIVNPRMHWMPTPLTKESLESFNPTIQKSMSRKGIISMQDKWAAENWETFPWCESIKPKQLWNLICCNCNECKGCNHDFCNDTLENHAEYVFKSNNPESLAMKRYNNAKHVLFTTRKIPQGYHVEWDSWKGTSFVKDEAESVPQKTHVTDYQISTMQSNGIECPSWYTYQDAYKIMGMIFKSKIAEAKETVKRQTEIHEHQKVHTAPFNNRYCEECQAWYIHHEDDETPLGRKIPAHDQIIYEEKAHEPTKRFGGPLCDPETGHLAFNEDGSLTYKRSYVGVVGVSKIPQWRVPFFKKEVEKVLNECIERFGIDHLTIVSGGANGVDSIVEEMCKVRGIDFKVYPSEVESWNDLGNKKGYKTRNLQIVAKATCKVYNLVGATKEPNCYHCSETYTCKCGMKRKTSHWHSGGCWTMHQAENNGTSTELIEVA